MLSSTYTISVVMRKAERALRYSVGKWNALSNDERVELLITCASRAEARGERDDAAWMLMMAAKIRMGALDGDLADPLGHLRKRPANC